MQSYQRMWENKGHRPYWALLHIYALTKPLEQLTSFSYKKTIFQINERAVNTAFFEKQEMELATVYFERWWKDKKNLVLYFKKVQNYFEEAERIFQETLLIDWKLLSTKEIFTQINKAAHLHGFAFLFVTQPQHVLPLEKNIQKILEKEPNAHQIMSSVTKSALPLPFDQEQEEITKYRQQWTILSTQQKEDILKKLVQKYGWLGSIEGETFYGEKHYEAEILSVPEKRQHVPNIEAQPQVKELGNLIALLSNQRIWSRWHGMRLRYCIKLGVQELARRWNISLLEYATLPEMELFTQSEKIDLQELERRKNEGYVAVIIDQKPTLLTGQKAIQYKLLVEEKIEETDTVHGLCANPGKITGKVRIISFASDDYHKEISQFQNGEILITGMTRPQIAHLCQKASAIITDEGGITSHASIISREFNIPCIIGTKNATKIFKTGDLVEIDAAHGTAKRIK